MPFVQEFVETKVKLIKAFIGQTVNYQQAEHCKHFDLLCSVASLREDREIERGGSRGQTGVVGKSGRRGTNEISQLWFEPSHVMAGPPLSHSVSVTLSLSFTLSP